MYSFEFHPEAKKELEKLNILHAIKLGRGKYFINVKLFNMLKKGI